ncbi:hypothetical protein N7520_001177 [Penicillium odoratum]|uniref:uncharacterized protein n=1 Tax=Penicillium odoratum TaxID=1167516 RepID=UPI002547CBDC|nr:uncharacterized protein N7520_001177 [Penicillium odoratum]KAJ5777931.1 hypothetical protein N7520_001177 [Penicillium odoratum]
MRPGIFLPPFHKKCVSRCTTNCRHGFFDSSPFTNTPTLIATHHCMQLLVSYIRYTISLLTLSPIVRILEIFPAENGDGGSQWAQRKGFMNNYNHDITRHERDRMNSVVFARASDQQMHSPVGGVWFDANQAKLAARQATPHDVENIGVWNGIPLSFGCAECHHTRGWGV